MFVSPMLQPTWFVYPLRRLAYIAVILGFGGLIPSVEARDINQSEHIQIADLIFKNECNRQFKCLVSWNDGEDFASLGIGHFIWFPKDSNAPFQESFPALMRWYQQHHVKIPETLRDLWQPNQDCPWGSQQDFSKPENQMNIKILRQFLADTKAVQASFIMKRLQDALPKILAVVSSEQDKEHIQHQFERVAATPNGWYALVDYVNFKGEGMKPSERYQGQGWGLTQVLLHMNRQDDALQAFVSAAKEILQQRVENAPAERHEVRWLKGWFKRLETYLLVSKQEYGNQ
ncbi:MAG: hypothetical protein Q9N67_02315 [Ghiorsea sp.]|nr:hypothetical protein [Ghiorsea sp.]